jgi:hypothetical protein
VILLATDLDGTLFPNSGYPHDSESDHLFNRWLALYRRKITLVYITGRHLELTLSGIEEFKMPIPDYLGCDVGTLLYKRAGRGFRLSKKWQRSMQRDFPRENIMLQLSGIQQIHPQEAAKQGIYKLSYYHNLNCSASAIQNEIKKSLQGQNLSYHLVMSAAPVGKLGLIDILPAQAGKENILCFLVQELKLPQHRVLYCGDSGNDLQAITSEFPAVLVANASSAVKRDVRKISRKRGTHDSVFFATKNYVAGILEALDHYDFQKFLK